MLKYKIIFTFNDIKKEGGKTVNHPLNHEKQKIRTANLPLRATLSFYH